MVFFSPSLYRLIFDLKTAHFVRSSIIFSNSAFRSLSFSTRSQYISWFASFFIYSFSGLDSYALAPIFAPSKREKCLDLAEKPTEPLASQARSRNRFFSNSVLRSLIFLDLFLA